MLEQNRADIRANVSRATTDDLLDRVTVNREGMEPDALDLIETELRRRGVSYAEQAAFGEARAGAVVRTANGSPRCCCKCSRVATHRQLTWLRLFKLIPFFPIRLAYCDEHLPNKPEKPLSPPPAAGLE
jgi:hypothetical protein